MIKLFQGIDTNNDKQISLNELKAGYNKFFEKNATEEEIEKMFFDADTNDSGNLNYEEFV